MKKTIYNDIVFKILLIGLLAYLFLWNLHMFLISKKLLSFISIVIQGFIIFWVITNHKYAKLSVKIWVLIIVTGSSLSFLGKVIKSFSQTKLFFSIDLLIDILIISIGLTIYYFNNKTVEVESISQ
ncbi:conserved membrane hypothetical protein [Tenacibaculum maritimum]|uniref:hypothetical protein n=1 Tax=Tenacibaculum maritimum TaxID=107401 RepID=UPI0012E5CADC|nr:hypothetical protein [Tenacibaculum maritimum]CAA0242581.1 conserved membrane hypothetical protein [Tenacibaculum maritimum]